MGLPFFSLSNTFKKIGQLIPAFEAIEKAKEILRATGGKQNFGICLTRMGNIYFSLGNLDLALENYLERDKLGKEVYEQPPPDESLKNGLAISYCKTGMLYLQLNESLKSLEQYINSVSLMGQLYAGNSKNANLACNYAESLAMIGVFCLKAGDLESAQAKMDLAKMIWVDLLAMSKSETYERKLDLLSKMLEKDANLDKLVIEMSSF